MRRLIIFLIRKKLGLKKWEGFRFVNQTSKNNWYFFGKHYIWKVMPNWGVNGIFLSDVSLNWLLNEKCEIKKALLVSEAFNEDKMILERGLS